MTRGRFRERVGSGPQSGLGAVGAALGVGLSYLAWHAAHSNYASGQVLASPSKDAHLHTFGWGLLPFGLVLLAAPLALAISGFRRARPRWLLALTVALVVTGVAGLAIAAVHFNSLSSVCACTSG